MKEKDAFLIDALLAPSGLFGDAVDSVVDRYQEARKQAVAFPAVSISVSSAVLYSRGCWAGAAPTVYQLLIQGDSKAERCLLCSPAAGPRSTTLKSRGLLRRSPI